MRLGVVVSGKGSNLRNLLDRKFDVVAVATNRPSCGGATFARERGIPLGELSLKRFTS
ncbi:MAG: phosphoribosylglycinamide formyltransferase, partial [Chloroflexi bacterium]